MRKITTMMAGASIEPVPSKESGTDSEIIEQLKEKFQSTKRADKLHVWKSLLLQIIWSEKPNNWFWKRAFYHLPIQNLVILFPNTL